MIEGDFVRLQRVTEEDYELLARWAASGAGAYTQGGAQAHTTKAVREAIEEGAPYLIIATLDGRKVGAVSWGQSTYPGSFRLGGGIGEPDLWEKGHGSEAMMLLLDHLFHACNAHRVQFTTGLFNQRMMAIVTRGLFVLEGVLRDYYFLDGEYHDGVICSILREEYYALAASGAFGSPRDAIPRHEKDRARALLRDYLERQDGGHLAALLRRQAPGAADTGGPTA